MGFPSFPSISAGLLLIVTTVLSIQSLSDTLKSLMRLFHRITNRNSNNNSGSWFMETSAPPLIQENNEEEASNGIGHFPHAFVAQDIRNSLPVSEFKGSNSAGVIECAVCLTRFEEMDEIRKLPCSHVFHSVCVDRWFDHEQTTCPMCRASLVPKETADKLRRRQQQLSEELMFWFASFHGHGFNSMWWLR